MANYRRLISYIYAYEDGVKGRNVGFAKLEARNGQCKVQVSVRKIYVGNQDAGVYLLTESREIFLGKMFVRGGAGEFRTSVSYGNVAGSNQTIDQCYGLTVHGTDDTWHSYTTIWEDAVAHAAAVDLSEATAERAREREMSRVPETRIPDERPEEPVQPEEQVRQEAPIQSERPISPTKPVQPEKSMPAEAPEEPKMPVAASESESASMEPEKTETIPGETTPPEELLSVPPPEEPLSVSPPEEPLSVPSPEEPPSDLPSEQETAGAKPKPAEPGGTGELSEDRSETVSEAEKLWRHFQCHYPKIQAFDYSGGCEILLIKPQDIGLLPREMWVYGNNSFLLHGYYNFRYLILARLLAEDGGIRFILGIPGHFYSNEKYMATMFGFPNFVLSKMQPANDGRFGYWYTDIRLES